MYTMLLAEGKEVELDENKFYPMTHRQKCAVVYEETMVMAYERYKKLGYLRAYSRMLKKFIREHAPMYVALFAIENYVELHKPRFNFIETIEKGLINLK